MNALAAVLLAPFVVVAVVASVRRPLHVALPVYAALLPFGSGLSLVPHVAFLSLSSLAGVVLTIGLAGRLLTVHRSASRTTPTVPIWLLFLAVAGSSILWSIAPQVTAGAFWGLASVIVLYTFLVLTPIDRDVLRRTETALIFGAVVSVGYGIAQLTALGGLPGGQDGGAGRFGNGFLGPNNQAAALLLPLAISLVRMASRSALRDRALHAGFATVILFGILMTGSRGGLLATGATLVLATVLSARGRGTLVAYGAFAAVLLALVLVVNPVGIGQRQLNQGESSSGRAEIWQVGMKACLTRCPTGAGWGTFPRVYELERASVPDVRVLRRGTSYEPHNIWLLAAVEAGFAGLVLMTAGLALSLREAVRLPRRLRAGPTAALLGTLVAGFFLSNLEFKFFWMALAYVAMSRNYADDVAARARLLRSRRHGQRRQAMAP